MVRVCGPSSEGFFVQDVEGFEMRARVSVSVVFQSLFLREGSIMRARNVVCGLAILVLGFCRSGLGGHDVYDDFPGTSLNLTNWQVQDATTPGVSGSNVNFSTSGAWQEINSTGSWNPATTTFEFKYAGGSGTQTFGLGDYPIVTEGYGSIEVKNTSGSWKFVNTKFLSSGTTYESPAFTAPVAGDVFDIAYISSNQTHGPFQERRIPHDRPGRSYQDHPRPAELLRRR